MPLLVLARRLHIIFTGRDMPVSSFPEHDDAEMQKRLLAMFLRSPEMVCLDNITDGLTFRSSAISAVMTSSVLTQRVLGVSRSGSTGGRPGQRRGGCCANGGCRRSVMRFARQATGSSACVWKSRWI